MFIEKKRMQNYSNKYIIKKFKLGQVGNEINEGDEIYNAPGARGHNAHPTLDVYLPDKDDLMWLLKSRAWSKLRDMERETSVHSALRDLIYDTEISVVLHCIFRSQSPASRDTYTSIAYIDSASEEELRHYTTFTNPALIKKGVDRLDKDMGDDTRRYVIMSPDRAMTYKGVIDTAINKFIKKDLVYCVRKDRLDVPDKYLANGKEGVEEYIRIKRAGNSNANIEHRLLVDEAAKRRRMIKHALRQVATKANDYETWKLPFIGINGRDSDTRMDALRAKLTKGMTNAELFRLSVDDIDKMACDYWRERLKMAIKKIDEYEHGNK